MNSLLMKEVLKSGVDRKEFAEFVGLEVNEVDVKLWNSKRM